MVSKRICKIFCSLFISIIVAYLFLPGFYEIHLTPEKISNPNHSFQSITGLEGAPEDIVIYKNIFLLSVRDTMTMWFKGLDNAKDGGIYCLYPPYDKSDFNILNKHEKIDKIQKNFEQLELKDYPKNIRFLPFGMKLIKDKLYVINQSPEAERIDIFKIVETSPSPNLRISLNYETSWVLPLHLKGKTNNLAIVSPTSFFITTFKPTNYDLVNQVSSHILFLKLTRLWFCKIDANQQTQCSQVQDSRANSEFNNGLEIDQYGRLYVAQLVSKRIAVFQLDQQNIEDISKIKFLRFIQVEGFPDNINYDPANDQLYVGCTSKLGEFFKVAGAITMKGEIKDDFTLWGTIITIKNDPNVEKLTPQIMLRQNDMIRGISAIAKIDNYYLAGTIIENRALLIKEE